MTTPSLLQLVERVRAVNSPGSFDLFVRTERERLRGAAHLHQGVFTGMRIQAFQNWLLEQNAEWGLTDAQLLAVSRLEFPKATGQVFTADVTVGLRIIKGIRAHFNRDGHGGPSPQSRGMALSVSYGDFASNGCEDNSLSPSPPVAAVPPPKLASAEERGDMLENLAAYYCHHGISALGFRCQKASLCRATSPRFTTAKESYVGPDYAAGNGPRLLFLSLDSGSASALASEKTMEAVRGQTLECDIEELPQNKHWYLTHAMAFVLLRQFHPELTIARASRLFAHVNSAKCCANNEQRAQADRVLFDNCRSFIPGELAILRPDVIITQGDAARDVIVKAMEPRRHVRRDIAGALFERGVVETAGGHDALWMHTYHPNNYGKFWRQQKHVWAAYAEELRNFLTV